MVDFAVSGGRGCPVCQVRRWPAEWIASFGRFQCRQLFFFIYYMLAGVFTPPMVHNMIVMF